MEIQLKTNNNKMARFIVNIYTCKQILVNLLSTKFSWSLPTCGLRIQCNMARSLQRYIFDSHPEFNVIN